MNGLSDIEAMIATGVSHALNAIESVITKLPISDTDKADIQSVVNNGKTAVSQVASYGVTAVQQLGPTLAADGSALISQAETTGAAVAEGFVDTGIQTAAASVPVVGGLIVAPLESLAHSLLAAAEGKIETALAHLFAAKGQPVPVVPADPTPVPQS